MISDDVDDAARRARRRLGRSWPRRERGLRLSAGVRLGPGGGARRAARPRRPNRPGAPPPRRRPSGTGRLLQNRRRVAQVLEEAEIVRHRGGRDAAQHLVLELRGHDGSVAFDDPRGTLHDPALRPLDVHLQEPDRSLHEVVQRERRHHGARVGQELSVGHEAPVGADVRRVVRPPSRPCPPPPAATATFVIPFNRSEDNRRRQFSEFGSRAIDAAGRAHQPGSQERVVARCWRRRRSPSSRSCSSARRRRSDAPRTGPSSSPGVTAASAASQNNSTPPTVQRTASASASCTVNAVGATWCSIVPSIRRIVETLARSPAAAWSTVGRRSSGSAGYSRSTS